MAHKSQMSVIQKFVELNSETIARADLLEIGSFDVNGSIRSALAARSYLGIDLVEGPGVDRVARVEALVGEGSRFDIVVCCEVLEHDQNWDETLISAFSALRPGGLLLVTCASTGRPEHGTLRTNPSHSPGTTAIGQDYYGNVSARQMHTVARSFIDKARFVVLFSSAHFDLVGLFVKQSGDPASQEEGSLRWVLPSKSELRRAMRTVDALEWIATRPLQALTFLPPAAYQEVAIRYVKALRFIFPSP